MKLRTYKDLLKSLQSLNEEQLANDLTFHDLWTDEFYGMELALEISNSDENDVLDDGHPYFAFNKDNTLGT